MRIGWFLAPQAVDLLGARPIFRLSSFQFVLLRSLNATNCAYSAEKFGSRWPLHYFFHMAMLETPGVKLETPPP